jgi:hypothetical protein
VLGVLVLAAVFCRASAQTTNLIEGFESTFPGGWTVGDNNANGTPAYWGKVNSAFGGEGTHGGSYKGYCAGIGYAGTTTNPTNRPSMTAYMQRSISLVGYSKSGADSLAIG